MEVKICKQKVKDLKQYAPRLRLEHLLNRRQNSLKRGDKARADAILKIIRKERKAKRWRRLRATLHPNRGGSVMSVKVPVINEDGVQTTRECNTQQEIFEGSEPVLTNRFTGAFPSPFYTGKLFNDLGLMGDTEYAVQVLEGTHTLLEGVDEATKMLLQECSKMYLSMSREEVVTYVTADDYQYYWKKVKETTVSS